MDNLMSFRPATLSLLSRLQSGVSHTELVHVPHPLWPFQDRLTVHELPKRPLKISILDASFNPPTLAHLALINANLPSKSSGNEDYDARLLLLSVKNADKTLKPTDATYVQRLDMMRLLAGHVRPSSFVESDKANVAVGIISEPTFVGKSKSLLSFLRHRLSSLSTNASHATTEPTQQSPQLELSFIVGMDTLERLVAPRYYDSEEVMMTSLRQFLSPYQDNCVIVCARRNLHPSPSSTGKQDVDDVSEYAQEFIDTGRIRLMDIGADESTFSSTLVRNTVKQVGVNEEGRKALGRYLVPSVMDYIIGEGLYTE